MSEKCLMKTLRFDVEVSIYNNLFEAAGYEDDYEGHVKLITDLMNARFNEYVFDNVLFESPPFEIINIDKSNFGESEVWEEVE